MFEKKIKRISIFLLLLVPAFVFADFKSSDYQYYKDIEGRGNGNYYLKIDKDIYAHGNQFFYDLRVVDQNNNEQKYDIAKIRDKEKVYEEDFPLKVIEKSNKTFIIDRGVDGGYIDKIKVSTESVDFSRVVDVYGSNLKDSRYERLTDKEGDLILVSPAKTDLEINFKYTDYRFLKIIFSGSEGDFKVDNFYIKKRMIEKEEGLKEKLKLSFESRVVDGNRQEILISLPSDNLPIDNFIIKTVQNDFERSVTLYASNNKDALIYKPGERYDSKKDYWIRKYSGRFIKKVYYDEQVFNILDNKKYYLLIIDNGDNEPIDIKEIEAERYLDILFLNNLDFSRNSYRLYYGNPFAKKANYDLTSFKRNLDKELQLSEEKKNNLYRAPVKKLGQERPYLIYIFISFLIIILAWFVYKILKEDATKDKDDVDYIEKL